MDVRNIFDLCGKTVVITGGAGYLGRAMSEALVAYGAELYILGRDFEKNKNFVQLLKDRYKCKVCETLPFNIDDDGLVESTFKEIVSRTGKVDVLINNAAYSCSKPFHEYNTIEWVCGIDGTINSVYRVTRYALPYMMMQKHGNIINIASMYGIVAPNMEIYGDSGQNNPANYGVGKAAIIQLTKYIASVYAKHGIRANTVSPGPFPNKIVQMNKKFITELSRKNPMNRVGQPEELQGIILYLASDASSYTNGQNIAVDGGWTAW